MIILQSVKIVILSGFLFPGSFSSSPWPDACNEVAKEIAGKMDLNSLHEMTYGHVDANGVKVGPWQCVIPENKRYGIPGIV